MAAWFSRSHRSLRPFVALAGLVLLVLSAQSAQAQWTLQWSDEFNGASGSAPDGSKWTYDLGNNFGNGEMDCAINDRRTSYMDGAGHLNLTALYSATKFPDCGGANNYISAHLKTAGLFYAGPYGKIEASIKTAQGPGIGQAFWAMGKNNVDGQGVPWPWCGELDIMEITWPNRGHNGWTLHGGQTDGNTYFEYGGISATADLAGGATFDSAFHIFGVQWSPLHVEYFLDNAKVGEVYQHSIGSTDVWPIEQPIFLILGLGVGASNSGTPDGVGYPKTLQTDYVHVYRLSAGAPAAPTGLSAVSNNSNAVTLSWTASSTAGVTYNIYASTAATFTQDLNTIVIENFSGTSWTHTGLANGTTYHYVVKASNYGGESAGATAAATTQAAGNSGGVKMAAGGYAVQNFMTAKYVLGGNSNYHYGLNVNTSGATSPAPLEVYRTERWGAAAWTITDLNAGGTYRVRLHFVEYGATASGVRNFDVNINNQNVLHNFDIFAAAGGQNKVVIREFDTKADEFGIIELQSTYGNSGTTDLNPSISAIEVNPVTSTTLVGSAPGNTTNLSINSGGGANGSWVADQGFNGGVTATTTNAITTSGVANAAPAAIYQDQRYVPFTYVMTGLQARATYTVRMHFAETYWTAAGQRVFNVDVNGKHALTNFDPFAAAGAQNKASVRDFSTKADMYGQIIVQLIYGGHDQPCIQGLEALETAPPATPTATSGATATPTNPAATPTATTVGATPTATPATGSNLALNRPCTASSNLQPCAGAFDGNAGTRWESTQGVDPQWIYVDLGSSVSVNKVVLTWETAAGKAYQIQTSNDAANWTSIYSTTTGVGGTETLNISGTGRYVRMFGTLRTTGYGYSLWEFAVYGGASSTPTSTATPTRTSTPTATTARATPTSTARPTPTATSGAAVLLSQGHTATASANPQFPPAEAFDGNMATRWASAQGLDPQWIYVDLGATHTVSRVVLTWETAFGKSYQIQTSPDAATWTNIFTTTTGDGGTDDLTGLSGSGRYVRMNGTARGTGYGYSLWEFQVYGN
jgi:beta-glucanase (GH16 family)